MNRLNKKEELEFIKEKLSNFYPLSIRILKTLYSKPLS